MTALYVYPANLPFLAADDHVFAPFDIAPERRRDQGELRQRQRFTWVPQALSCRAVFSQVEFDTFFSWHEATLRGGAERFDIQVAEQGPWKPVWWTVQFLEPYEATHIRGDLWSVRARLLLVEKVGDYRFAPSLMAEGGWGLDGSARSDGPTSMASGGMRFGGRATTSGGVSPTTPSMRAIGGFRFGGYCVATPNPCRNFSVLPASGGAYVVNEDIAVKVQSGASFDVCRALV